MVDTADASVEGGACPESNRRALPNRELQCLADDRRSIVQLPGDEAAARFRFDHVPAGTAVAECADLPTKKLGSDALLGTHLLRTERSRFRGPLSIPNQWASGDRGADSPGRLRALPRRPVVPTVADGHSFDYCIVVEQQVAEGRLYDRLNF